jgi:hypothetical protein
MRCRGHGGNDRTATMRLAARLPQSENCKTANKIAGSSGSLRRDRHPQSPIGFQSRSEISDFWIRGVHWVH